MLVLHATCFPPGTRSIVKFLVLSTREGVDYAGVRSVSLRACGVYMIPCDMRAVGEGARARGEEGGIGA